MTSQAKVCWGFRTRRQTFKERYVHITCRWSHKLWSYVENFSAFGKW